MKLHSLSLALCAFLTLNVAAENVVVENATKAGIKKCLPAIKYMSNFLIKDGDHGAHSQHSVSDPNNQIFTTFIERNYSDGELYTNLVVAPTTSGKCAAAYDQINYHPKSCTAVSKETYVNFKYVGTLNKKAVGLQSDDVTVYLIPTDNGCISVKKEILMDASPLKPKD